MGNYPELFRELENQMIGFDSMFDRIRTSNVPQNSSFPPYNLIRDGDSLQLEFAVAGYDESDLMVDYRDSILTISGKKSKESEDEDIGEYLHRGIARRSFEQKFTLADTVIVDDAELTNGILVVYLHNEVPESKKARTIPIGNSTPDTQQLNG